jgi:radical SAM superfamily enzyme YgiQ (UPF0313 family)
MKVLLASPNYACFEPVKTVHLGLAYIAAVLENNGYDVSIVDLNVESEEKFKKLVKESDVLGITATTITIAEVWNLVKKAKKSNPDIKIILGGPHPTCQSSEILGLGNVDYVVIGEGEVTMLELLKAIENKKDLRTVKGIAFKKNNKIITNRPRPLIKDLDSLPFPAYHLFPSLDKYTWYVPHPNKRGVGIMTSRGCPFNCIYCYKGLFGYTWRARSPENVFNEWKFLINDIGAEEIAIYDDIFNLSLERVNKIYDLVLKNNLVIPHFFPNGVRAEFVDLKTLQKMKKAGCIRIAFGVETGSKRIMKTIDKRLDFNKIRKAFKLCEKVGIESTAFFILGLPGENRQTMQETIDFAKELNPTFAQFTTLTPFVGTRVYDLIKKEGELLEDWNVKFSSHFDRPEKFKLGELTPELMLEMKRKAYREFYFRPGYLLKNLRLRNLCWENVKRIFHYSS